MKNSRKVRGTGAEEADEQPSAQLIEVVTEGHAVLVGMGWHLQHGGTPVRNLQGYHPDAQESPTA